MYIHQLNTLPGESILSGGGGSRDKSDARSKRAIFVSKSLIYSFNISEFVFIVAVFINKNK